MPEDRHARWQGCVIASAHVAFEDLYRLAELRYLALLFALGAPLLENRDRGRIFERAEGLEHILETILAESSEHRRQHARILRKADQPERVPANPAARHEV